MPATYTSVDAKPVKAFFVSMLTRDISLTDAILDLLDNCVDGILRSKPRLKKERPYSGFYAHITFDKDTFAIHDNCGGIPWALHEYAFRMGRADGDRDHKLETVGVYGIGMKRAIFKIGEECLISTQNKHDAYEVHISPEWIQDPETWAIPVTAATKKRDADGTSIVVGRLTPGVSALFSHDEDVFLKELMEKIESHYAFIIAKGFKITVNDREASPKPTKLAFDETDAGIKPFFYKTTIDDVEVFIAAGFTQPIPSQEDIISEQSEKRYSSENAGWTVICNDRAVLYCDRTELTGWGVAGIPRYHTQFIAFSGIVEFRSKIASKLPTTTTKRGIDPSSVLYLKIKDKMQEGMRMFTDYTNKWKGNAAEAQTHLKQASMLTLSELQEKTDKLKFNKTARFSAGGEQFRPSLPQPKIEKQEERISFTVPAKNYRTVSKYLFDEDPARPSEVGRKCFDFVFQEATQ